MNYDDIVDKIRKKVNYNRSLDKEVVTLCAAINKFKYIETWVSCCGHEKTEFVIGCHSKTEKSSLPLENLIQTFSKEYNGWLIKKASSKNFEGLYSFSIVGPIGAFTQANELAEHIEKFLKTDEGKIYGY